MSRALFIIAALAGLLGAAGVAAAAASAHLGGGQLLDTAATFLLIHSAALLGLAAVGQRASRAAAIAFTGAALLLILGLMLFCGDFAMRALAQRPLFPMAAPSGGFLLITGWLTAALAGALAAAGSREVPCAR
jgi:uncharacterized membrane protein YgdD (TMEM256/DUF423 family)